MIVAVAVPVTRMTVSSNLSVYIEVSDFVLEFSASTFNDVALQSTQPPTQMSTTNISLG